MRVAWRSLLATAACCAGLVIAAPAVGAKTFKYEGPVNLADLPGSPPAPRIEFKANFDAKKAPTSILFFKERGIYAACTDGAKARYSEGGTTFDHDLRVNKKRRFAGNAFDGGPGDSFRVTGVVPRKGPIRGTIRIRIHFDAVPGQAASDCDTGLLTWTATRG
jgi:hypothetical protein